MRLHGLAVALFFASVSAFAGPNKAPEFKPVKPVTGVEDPERARSWHLDSIGAPEAWKTTQGTRETIIAVVDSGVDYNHPELGPNIVLNPAEKSKNGLDDDGNEYPDDYLGWDYIWASGLPFDRSGHGTFMASIIAGRLENGVGGAGVCPECGILPVRFINHEGMGDTEDAVQGIYYAVRRGASIVNFSFSGEGYDRELEAAIRYAGQQDVLVVVSASNDEENLDYADTYPAKFSLPNMITVGGSNVNDELWEGSNWGKKSVHLLAPGEDIPGLWFEKFDLGSGTSEAAAVVSGVAGLIRTANPDLSAEQVKNVLIKTVRKVTGLSKKTVSGGVVDAAAAIRCVSSSALTCLK